MDKSRLFLTCENLSIFGQESQIKNIIKATSFILSHPQPQERHHQQQQQLLLQQNILKIIGF